MTLSEEFKARFKQGVRNETKTFTISPKRFNFVEGHTRGGDCYVEESDSGRYYYPLLPAKGTDIESRRGTTLRFPSVTTVLGNTQSEAKKKSLDEWLASDPAAKEILEKAGKRGNALHEAAENYLIGDIHKIKLSNLHFRQIYPILRDRVNNILRLESVLYSTILGIAGRTDLIAEFDGVLSVIDFKSARKEKEEHDIEDYFIQETMYATMEKHMSGREIKQIVTLMARDNTFDGFNEPQIWIKQTKDYIKPMYERIHIWQKKQANA